jgi:histidinol-phosphate/aromatic aminotransferase/cobyric acid decarboxylase-like protein
VKERPPTPSAQLSASLSRYPPEVVALVRKCLTRLRRAFPGAYQLVYAYSHSLVVAFGTSDRGYEAIVALAVSPREVRLYFDKSLPDPKGLLEGSGGKVRSVTLESAADLDRGDIHALIKAAIEHSGATFPRNRSIRIVIKSASKKRRTRQRE